MPTTKAEWQSTIQEMEATWNELMAQVPSGAGDTELVVEEWTLRDIVAHVNSWRILTVNRLEAAVNGGVEPEYPYPETMDDETDDGTDEINAYFEEINRNRSFAEVSAIAAELFERMNAAVQALSEEELFEVDRYSWLPGYPLAAVLDGTYEHQMIDHVPDIQTWLRSRKT